MVMMRCGGGDLIGACRRQQSVYEGTGRPCSVAGLGLLLVFGEGVNAYLIVCGEGLGYQLQSGSKLWLMGKVRG